MRKSSLYLSVLISVTLSMSLLCGCQDNNRVLASAEAEILGEETVANTESIATAITAETTASEEHEKLPTEEPGELPTRGQEKLPTEEQEDLPTEEPVYITAEDASNRTSHMALYKEYPFNYADTEWSLQKYVQEDMLIDGELALDDRAQFLIQLVSKDAGCQRTYVLFDEAVQLGEPSVDVWTDVEDRLHVTLRDVRTARYKLIDHIYIPAGADQSGAASSPVGAEPAFSVKTILDADGINYMGGLS